MPVRDDLPLDRWPALASLGSTPAVTVPAAGTMNDTWIIGDPSAGPDGAYVLRRHRFLARDRVAGEHRVMSAARARGVPVPAVLPTRAGESALEHAGRWWTLYGFASGVQVPREALSVGHAHAMGTALAGLHLAVADLDMTVEPRRAPRSGPTLDEVLGEIGHLRALVAARPNRSVEDDWADAELVGHATWLNKHGLPDPEPVPDDEIQVLHGDYQDANVFFDPVRIPTVVTSVIDWDKSGFGPRAFEVVRCLKLAFEFEPALCRAFLAGYRSAAPLPPEQLSRAVHNEHARAVRGLWLPRMIYLHGEDRLRRFLTPAGFTTVADTWPVGLC